MRAESLNVPLPRLRGPTDTVDLGNGKPGEVVAGAIELQNSGTGILRFKITASCGCTGIDPPIGAIAAGKSLSVSVSVKLPAYGNSERSVRLSVESNDLSNPIGSYLVIARSVASIQVSPSAVYLGTLLRSEIGRAECLLTLRDSVGNPVRDASLVSFRAKSGHTLLAPVTVAGDEVGLRVSLDPTFSEAEFHDDIELTLGESAAALSVPVYAHIVEPIRVIPSTVFLSREAAGGGYKAVNILIHTDRPLGALKKVEGPSGITLTDSDIIRPQIRSFRLEATEPLMAHASYKLAVFFDEYEKPITLKVLTGSQP